jgi:hypothetical protein
MHTRLGPGTKPQIALESEIQLIIIPLGTLLRQMRHTEFHMRLSAGTGPAWCALFGPWCALFASEGLQCSGASVLQFCWAIYSEQHTNYY